MSVCCVYHVKDTNRKQFTTDTNIFSANFELCLSCQRYKSKAIHNFSTKRSKGSCVVFIMSKIQIESNSQLCAKVHRVDRRCVYHVKDTNRKQFTTIANVVAPSGTVVFIMSKIQIESNSQQRSL